MGKPRLSARRVFVILLAASASVSAQTTSRRATNLAALFAYPGFFHGRPIVMIGKVATDERGQARVSDDEHGSIRLLLKGSAPDGLDEIRGEFWDLSRMRPDDPRLGTYDLRTTFGIDPDGAWPKAGEATAIVATTVTPATPPPAPSIRAIVLHPSRYLDQKITITGQYSGRNLLGDLPDAPGRSRYDFVLRSTDAAIWVINMRPKGKDFDLALDARIDTNRWLTLRGTVQEARGLQWIDAEAGTLALAKPPVETPAEAPVRVPAGPPPEVVFSAPTEDETDVPPATSVRIQFSRDIDPATIKNHVRASYAAGPSAAPAGPDIQPLELTTQYNAANRVLEIRFKGALERFRIVKMELLEGIAGTDGQALKPWTLTFATGS